MKIARIKGREILDSRGNPTVEADVILEGGTVATAAAPSGASVGSHEARELRDGVPERYRGLGVRAAVRNVTETFGPALRGCDPTQQRTVDEKLIELDGTNDKRILGANASTAVSLAVARAGATARGLPLYRHIADLAGNTAMSVPAPMFNIISGGMHSGWQLDIQDVLVMPRGSSFSKALEQAADIHFRVGQRLRDAGHQPLVADEGGWAPPLASNEAAVAWATAAAHEVSPDIGIAIDVAAQQLRGRDGRYLLARDRVSLSSDEITAMLVNWVDRFPIASIEDPLGEDDWPAWVKLTATLGHRVQVVGDDLFATSAQRVQMGIDQHAATAVLIKINQVGTLTEALDVMSQAKAAGFTVIASARSGETEDSFLADFAVGAGADQMKVGSVTRSSRLAKWNQLLRIEEQLSEH